MFTLVGVDKVIRESKKCNPHEAIQSTDTRKF